MIVTDAAKEILLASMERAGKEVCHIGLVVHSCGGKGLDPRLIKKEEATRLVEINGVLFDLTEDAEAFLDGFTFDGDGNRLCLIPPEHLDSGCGDCHEEECDEHCGCHHHHC